MPMHASPELEQAKKIEQRAHQIKMAMYEDEEFMAGIKTGYEQSLRGELMTWAELRQALGRAHIADAS
jgi:hypothetical protein